MNSIVVIEDDPAILRGLADTLRSECYEVVTSATGEDGYRLVQERQPDLVILDLLLPGVSGYEVCRQMRRQGLMTPVLMLSAEGREGSRVRGFEAGADDYVTKPFSIRELLGRVRAILRRSEGRADPVNRQAPERRLSAKTAHSASNLSAQELRLLQLLADGFFYDSAGRQMEISVNTVRSYVRSMYEKLHVNTKSEAVSRAFREGLIR